MARIARQIDENELPPGFRAEDVVGAGADPNELLRAFLTGCWDGIGDDMEDEHGRRVRAA